MNRFESGSIAVTCEPWEEIYPSGEAERGARVEVRRIEEDRLGPPVWRADLFGLVGGRAGYYERAHFHRQFRGWMGGPRYWSEELRTDPVGWTMARLADLPGTLVDAGTPDLADALNVAAFRRMLPRIQRAVEQCMFGLPNVAESDPLFKLVPGRGGKPPVFFLTGSGTGLPYIFDLWERVAPDRPLYAGAAGTLLWRGTGLVGIEEAAGRFMQELRKLQDRGSFLLVGYSYGGLVAYEIARRLRMEGEDVPLLVLIDTVALRGLPIGSRARIVRNRMRASLVTRLPMPARLALRGARRRFRGDPAPEVVPQSPEAHDGTWTRLRSRGTEGLSGTGEVAQVLRRYHPLPIAGHMTLIRTGSTASRCENPELGWSRLVQGQLMIEEIPGRHGGLLREPYVRTLAERLAARVEQINA